MWIPDGPVWVVEPHADDAYLSLGWHMAEWAKRVPTTLVTVYSATRKRRADAMNYTQAIGCDWLGLGMVEGDSIDAPTAEFATSDFAVGDGTMVWPLGLRHAEHLAVAAARPPGAIAYLDQPYSTQAKNAPAVQAALAGRTVVSYVHPPTRKWKHNDLFKDQRLYFHRHAEVLPRCPEVLTR